MPLIERNACPQAKVKKGEDYFTFQVPLNQAPNGDWLDLFGGENISYTSMLHPRMVRYLGATAEFDSHGSRIAEHIQLFDQWLEETNRLYEAQQARVREIRDTENARHEAERKEIAELNERLKNL